MRGRSKANGNRQARTWNRISQLTILLGVFSFSFGMFYWLFTMQWQGVVGGVIAFFTMLMTAAVLNMQVAPTPEHLTIPHSQKWVGPNDPTIVPGFEAAPGFEPHEIPTQQPTQQQPGATSPAPSKSDDWKPPNTTPPDTAQSRDPFAS